MPVSMVYKNCQQVYLRKAVKIKGINQQGLKLMLVHEYLFLTARTHPLIPEILRIDLFPTIYLSFVTVDQLVNGCRAVSPSWKARLLI